jgi:transposase
MVEPEVLRQLRALRAKGWGAKRIARELEISRNTVRRYARGGSAAEVQVRPKRRALDDRGRAEALRLFDGPAQGNAVLVARLLRESGTEIAARTVQKLVAAHRREQRAAALATVRYESAPGHQLQVDFGQKQVRIAGELVRVFVLCAVLSYSRRIFVKAFLSERQDDWRQGLADSFRHFGGVPATVLCDNARALVVDRDRATGIVTFHPAYVQFCRDWDVTPRACAPYRARTKGKTESGVKYVKRNGLAGLEFTSFAALEAHLARWIQLADSRIHGTTHERPTDRFDRDERQALRPLPARPLPVRAQRLIRRVANDALVDVDTVRYSVPHRFVRDRVEVQLGETTVLVFHGQQLVATHRRSFEPYARVVDPAHWAGLWRPARAAAAQETPKTLETMGRTLSEYAAVVEGGAG